MTRPDLQPLREILQQAQRRYLSVRPHGFELNPGTPLRPVLAARILSFGSARTLYQDRRPLCRSLDGIAPSAPQGQRRCADCALRPRCTAQVRLDLLVDTQPYRLLLAHTSAKNFLLYDPQLRQRGIALYAGLRSPAGDPRPAASEKGDFIIEATVRATVAAIKAVKADEVTPGLQADFHKKVGNPTDKL